VFLKIIEKYREAHREFLHVPNKMLMAVLSICSLFRRGYTTIYDEGEVFLFIIALN
jgi:hypothetical protein